MKDESSLSCVTGETEAGRCGDFIESKWLTPEWLRLSVQCLCRQGSSAIFSPSAISLSDSFFYYYYINFTSLYNLFAEHFILLHKTTNLLIISKIQYSFLNFSNYIFSYFLFHQAFYQFWFLFKYFFVLSVSLKAVSSHVVCQLYAFRARSSQGGWSCVPVSD